MNHSHRKLIQAIFAHPIPANLQLHEVEAVLRDLGAEVGHSGHGRFTAMLKGQRVSLHGNGHSLSKEEVAQLRKVLEAAGVEPADYPA